MKTVTTWLTAAALASAGLMAADATTAAPQPDTEKVQLVQLKLKRAPAETLRPLVLCSPKYKPSSNASSASRKGGSYTCTHTMAIPPGKKCRNGFDPSSVEAKVLPGGKYVRLVYRCQSHPW